MSKRTAKILVALGLAFLGGAAVSAWFDRPDRLAICTRAADHHVHCVETVFGADAPVAEKVRAQRDEGIPACVEDGMTVAMYQSCLEETDCEAFTQCLMDFVVRK